MEELPFDLFSFPTPTSLDEYPKTRLGKTICRNITPTMKQTNNCASSLTLKSHLCKMTMIPHPGFEYIVILDFGAPPKVTNRKTYPLRSIPV